MSNYHVKKGDKVFVNSGNFRGEEAVITAILPRKNRVVIELADKKDTQLGMKTIKRSQQNPSGGMVERTISVHVSNVTPLDSAKGDKKSEK